MASTADMTHVKDMRDTEENSYDEYIPKMSDDFYVELDTFLNLPPPKINKITSKYQDIDGDDENKQNNPIKPSQAENIRNRTITSKVKSKSDSNKAKSKKIDLDLVNKAFAYVDTIANSNTDEQVNQFIESDTNKTIARKLQSEYTKSRKSSNQERVNFNSDTTVSPYLISSNKKPFSSNNSLSSSTSQAQSMKSNNKSAYSNSTNMKKVYDTGLVNRLRNQTNMYAIEEETTKSFKVSAVQQGEFNRSKVDYNTIIENFQSGKYLSQLREEYAQSQRNLSNATEFMKVLVNDTIEGSKR